MRKITIFFATSIVAVLTACDSTYTASLGETIILDVPDSAATGPRLSDRPDGRLVLSWMAESDAGAILRFAEVSGGELTAVRDVATDERMFVNWADLPSVMQVGGEHWLAHWLRYSADKTYSYDVVVSQSFDGGRTWSHPVAAHDDGTPTEHGFVSMHRSADGVTLLWLDGRGTPDGPMTLRSAVMTPGGERQRQQLVDDSVCDCCQTDVAVSSHGPIAVYRDRTEDEIRDIYVARFSAGRWGPGTRLYADDWNIAGCPVNGPSIVAHGDDVAVAWFSAADDAPVVRIRRSDDGGMTFAAPIEIADGRLSGYVGLAHLPNEQLAVSWVSRDDDGHNRLNLRVVGPDGTPGPTRQVATIEQLRVFPQLGYQEGSLFLFWTDQDGDTRRMHAARVPVS
jgi:hypothetical protein